MQLDEKQFVFGTDRTDLNLHTILHCGRPHVTLRIGSNGEARNVLFLCFLGIYNDACIERDQAVGRGEQRIDVDFLDPALLNDQLTEADEQ